MKLIILIMGFIFSFAVSASAQSYTYSDIEEKFGALTNIVAVSPKLIATHEAVSNRWQVSAGINGAICTIDQIGIHNEISNEIKNIPERNRLLEQIELDVPLLSRLLRSIENYVPSKSGCHISAFKSDGQITVSYTHLTLPTTPYV